MTLSPDRPPRRAPGPADGDPPTRYRAREPVDLVAVAPIVLGFVPSESVVMLTFGIARPFHARIDLPVVPRELALRRAVLDELAAALVEPAVQHRVGGVVLLLYTAHERLAASVWRHLRRVCAQAGIAVVEALRVDERRYFPLLGGDRRLAEVGVPYDLATHPFTAQAVLDGRIIHRSRAAMVATLDPDPERLARVAARVAAAPAPPLATGAEQRAAGEEVIAVVTAALVDGRPPDDDCAARLLRLLECGPARHAAWSLLTAREARAHVSFWTDLVRRAPRSLVPAPATLLGWAAWLGGDGALAWAAVDRCRAGDPGDEMAELLTAVLEQAVSPEDGEYRGDWAAGLD